MGRAKDVREKRARERAEKLKAQTEQDAIDGVEIDGPADDLLTTTVIDDERPAEENVDDSPWNDYTDAAGNVMLPGLPSPPKNRITVIVDHKLTFPDLWLNVYVEGDHYDQVAFAKMFVRAACKKALSPEAADLVIFTGGVDVDPQLYGAKPHPMTDKPNSDRDAREIALYLDCLEKGIPMLGVCRGAQFLHVMNQGRLFQHVDNHNGGHSMMDVSTKEVIENVSSVHHQMVMPNRGMEILATCAKSRNRYVDDKKLDKGIQADIEAFFYRESCCLGIQGHPEYYGYNYFTAWTLKQIEQYVLINPDVDWEEVELTDADGKPDKFTLRRVKPEILSQRKQLVMAAAEQVCLKV